MTISYLQTKETHTVTDIQKAAELRREAAMHRAGAKKDPHSRNRELSQECHRAAQKLESKKKAR